MVGGSDPFYLKFLRQPAPVEAKSPILNRYPVVVCMYFVRLIQLLLPNQINHYYYSKKFNN